MNFNVVQGTIISEIHLQQGKPCQDAIMVSETDEEIILIQSDGVSTCKYSDVGARLLTHLCQAAINELKGIWIPHLHTALLSSDVRKELIIRRYCELVKEHILKNVRVWILSMGVSNLKAVHEYLSATLSFVWLTRNFTFAAGTGDGYFILNSEARIVTECNGSPTSISYALCDSKDLKQITNTDFVPLHLGHTVEVETIGLSSDGLEKFNKLKNVKLRKNDDELVGPLNQFWETEKYLDPLEIQRRINIMTLRNGVWPEDDVSFAVAVRKK